MNGNMKNALLKDIFREIKRTLSRFLAIFFIVALGVGFFAGVKATCPDMKITADKYFDEYNLMDIRLVSTIGFNNDDINAVRKVPGVESVFPTYSMDALANIDNKDIVLKVIAMPVDKVNNADKSYINIPRLISGRFPEKPYECVVEKGKIITLGMSIGSKIKLNSGNNKDIKESLKLNEFTIVGFVETPYYISFERGTSSIGNGKINNFIMIPQDDFKIPAYTDVFMTVKGAADKQCYDKSYSSIIDSVKTSLEKKGKQRSQIRYDEIISDSNKKLNENKDELASAEAKQQLDLKNAESEIQSSKIKINDGENKLRNEMGSFYKTLNEAQDKIIQENMKLKKSEDEYNLKLQSYFKVKAESDVKFQAAQKKIDDAAKELRNNEDKLLQLKSDLSQGKNLPITEKIKIQEQIDVLSKQLNTARSQIEASQAQLNAERKALLDMKEGLDNSSKTIDNAKEQLYSQQKKIDDSKRSAEILFSVNQNKLSSSRSQLQTAETEFKKAKNESDAKIADARKKIDDAEDRIGKIERPSWYVLDRNTNPGFVEFGSNADRIDAISKVFPLFFFLIAALVCLTTMTRMVDEQRISIGILKALGYSNASIASKYIIYAALASISGGIFGLFIGLKVFPTVIFNAYEIMYSLPSVIITYNIFYAVISIIPAVLGTTAAAWIACYSELLAVPAELMLPKVPKPGKRVFLERIKFIWSRFNFTQKITARNLLRYKKRFFMTIIGIAGCTALLLAGFGLKDSILSIVTKQFDELYRYQMVVELQKSSESKENAKLIDFISIDNRISDYLMTKEQNIDIGKGKIEKSVILFVPESKEKLKSFILLRDRRTHKEVPLTDEGVVLTEKLASKLNAGVGDTIFIKDGNSKKVKIKVTGITENYVSHYVYISKELYASTYGKKADFTQILAKTTGNTEDFQSKLSTDLLKNNDTASISFITGISKNFSDIIGSLNYVVLVLIFSAGLLAFVVLYNLTNINVTERIREIATIKVLGFYDNEVSSYVYRENIILTIIGMIIGLLIGIFLHKFIVVTSEIDYVMFGRNINLQSYIYSGLLTIIFSGLVNLVMYFKLKKIDMVESMKSVD